MTTNLIKSFSFFRQDHLCCNKILNAVTQFSAYCWWLHPDFSIATFFQILNHFHNDWFTLSMLWNLPTLVVADAPNSTPWLPKSPLSDQSAPCCPSSLFFVHFEILELFLLGPTFEKKRRKRLKMSTLPMLSNEQRRKLAGAKKYCMEQTLR